MLTELAAIVSDALQRVGIVATLSGGAAVSIYTENRYQSEDLDFVLRIGSIPVASYTVLVASSDSRKLYL